MVDNINIPQVNQLYEQQRVITQAINAFDEGGRILNMIVGTPIINEETEEHQGWISGSLIDVSTMEYPSQMKDAIIHFLENRLMEINNELMTLGVTGVEEPRPRSPEPHNEKPKSKSKRRAA